jgi:hypothetical protein
MDGYIVEALGSQAFHQRLEQLVQFWPTQPDSTSHDSVVLGVPA